MSGEPTWPNHSGTFAPDSGQWRAPVEGRYTRERVLGLGGMGEVWQARDSVLRRVVALKVGRPDLSESESLRLVREARITASLDHPGIVPVFDAGEDIDGRPFYTMRVVRGRSMEQAIEQAPDLAARLDLLPALLRVCEALAFAHQAGVVHRDIKPDNLRVGVFGEVQVMDWGLARTRDEDPAWAEVLSQVGTRTQAGVILGTPAYMSPEQARADPVGPPSDVWSLGLVLRELICGRRAYTGASAHQLIAQVLAGPPQPLQERVAPELLAILNKALQHDPCARYADAGEMSADLSAFVLGKRVSAHRYSVKDELARSVKRWRWPMLAVLAGVVGLGIAGGVGLWRAEQERARLSLAQQELAQALALSDHNLSMALVSQALNAAGDGDWGLAEVLAAQALVLEENPDARGVLSGALSAQRPELVATMVLPECDKSVMGVHRLYCLQGSTLRGLSLEGGDDWSAQLLLDSLFLDEAETTVFAVTQHSVSLIDARTGALLSSLQGGISDRQAPAVAPGLLVTLHMGTMPDIQVLSQSGRQHSLPCPERVAAAAVLDLEQALVSCEVGTLDWIRPAGRVRLEIQDKVSYPRGLLLSKDGALAALTGMFGELQVVDTVTGQTVFFMDFGQAMVSRGRFSPDARWIAVELPGDGSFVVDLLLGVHYKLPRSAVELVFADDKTLKVRTSRGLETWSLPSGRPPYIGFSGGLVGLDWQEHGLAIAAGNHVGRVDLESWTLESTPPGGTGIKDVLIKPDGELLVGTLKGLYTWRSGDTMYPITTRPTRRLHSLQDGHWLRVGPDYSAVVTAQGQVVPGSQVLGYLGVESYAAPGGTHAVMTDRNGRIVWLQVEPLSFKELGTHPAHCLGMGPGGWPVYLGGPKGIHTLDESGQETLWIPLDDPVYEIAISPDGRLLAAAGRERIVRLYDRESGRLLATLRGHERRIATLEFSPDSRTLATGSWDDTLRFWDLAVLDADPQVVLTQAQASWGL